MKILSMTKLPKFPLNVECRFCGSKLEVNASDLRKGQMVLKEDAIVLDCPVCGNVLRPSTCYGEFSKQQEMYYLAHPEELR